MLRRVADEKDVKRLPPYAYCLETQELPAFVILQVMSLKVVKEVVKALLKVMEVLKVVKALSPPSMVRTTTGRSSSLSSPRFDQQKLSLPDETSRHEFQ